MASARRIAVLGASGVVGRGLVKWLSKRADAEVIGICRNAQRAGELHRYGLASEVLRLDDAALRFKLAGFDVVINAIRPEGRLVDWRRTDDTIARLLVGLPASCVAIHLSSVSVYGQFYRHAEREFAAPSARGVYARNKRWMENRLLHYARGAAPRRIIIARVGHVWGLSQGWTRTIIDTLHDPTVRLALGGAAPSNAIHIGTLASTLWNAIPGDPVIFVANAVHAPQWTWRVVFDLHSDALGLPRIAAANAELDGRILQRLRYRYERHVMLRALSELAGWMCNPSADVFRVCPSLREAGSRLLVRIGAESLEERLRGPALTPRHPRTPDLALHAEPWMVGDPVPGPVLAASFPPAIDCIIASLKSEACAMAV